MGDAFQEKDIIRILIAGGGAIYDKEEGISIAQYIFANIEDVLEEFENPIYRKIVLLCKERITAGDAINTDFFVNHVDPDISRMAINMITSPYEYSENWENRWDIHLHSQKKPENNFPKDGEQALKRFKLRKVIRMCEENQKLIQELVKSGDDEQLLTYMKVQQRLLDMRNTLAKELGTVVL